MNNGYENCKPFINVIIEEREKLVLEMFPCPSLFYSVPCVISDMFLMAQSIILHAAGLCRTASTL